MSEPPKTVRVAARSRMPLDGADAQALEGALSSTERERDAARARVAELEDPDKNPLREEIRDLHSQLGELQETITEACGAVGKGWLAGGVSLAEAITRKTQVLEDEREKPARARVSALLEKWDRDLLTYPEATDERAHYAATAIKACITELRAALDAAEPAPVEGVRLGAPFPSTFYERVAHALGMCEQPEGQSGWHVATEDELIGGIERLQAAKGDCGVVCDAAEWQRRALAAESEVGRLRERTEKAEANYRFMVERAADEKLDGYRELGQRAAAAEQRAERAEAEVAKLRFELERAVIDRDAAESRARQYLTDDKEVLARAEARVAELERELDAAQEHIHAGDECITSLHDDLARVADLVRKAHEHWDAIRWPEDKLYIAILAEAIEVLTVGGRDALPSRKGAARAGERCHCQWEAGDSPCPMHGEDES